VKERTVKYVIFILLISFAWLFSNQAMNGHSHLYSGGQIISHAHPYTPDKNSHSPFQSHKHQPSIAFFLDLITSLNLDSFGILLFALFISSIFAAIPLLRQVPSYQECYSFHVGRAPPGLR
jgi:hypothetical protein